MTIQDNTHLLIEAAQNGNVGEVERLISVSVPTADDQQLLSVLGVRLALLRSAQMGHTECVKLLIAASNRKVNGSDDALETAADGGHVECVKLLVTVSDPKNNDSWALRLASSKGHTECVKFLIPLSDPKIDDSSALRAAAINGHTECVELLIPVSDPKARSSAALQHAVFNNRTRCVDLLFDVSDPHAALHILQSEYHDRPKIWQYLECKIAQQQKMMLNKNIKIEHTNKFPARKI